MASKRHAPDPNVAATAALIGDPARAAMLFALLDGRELPAAELAYRAGASPQAASAHLAKLVAGGLLVVTPAGRRRLFRLASADVGVAVEALAAIATPARIVALDQNLTMQRLRIARSCYDHLACLLAVAVADRLQEDEAVVFGGDRVTVTTSGERAFRRLGTDLTNARASRRTFARACLDWTERRPHLAGALGAALLGHFLSAGWVSRNAHDRALSVTPAGLIALRLRFRIDLERPALFTSA